eukprot:4687364-Prymnesium_polylepis.1
MAICCERHWNILKKEISYFPPSLGKWRKEICLRTPGKSRLAYSVSFSFGHYLVYKTSRMPIKHLGPLYMME